MFEIEPPLCAALTPEALILTAPTGSGKSTQVPQMLLDRGLLRDGQVAILQPRRLATRLLAAWVAQARREPRRRGGLSDAPRQRHLSRDPHRYLTEGVLLRRMLADPDLRGVSAVIFDEFHERHLYGDITLARALQIQESSRPDLIVVVMSATLDVSQVAMVKNYLQPCAVLSSQGRAYPVAIEYLSQPAGGAPVWELAVKELKRLVREHPRVTRLFSCPGLTRSVAPSRRRAMRSAHSSSSCHCTANCRREIRTPRWRAMTGAKSSSPPTSRKRSLTIDGVRLVIDSGLARMPRYDPYRGINTLLIEKISRAAADQRAGRAGRTAPGHCLRLWTRARTERAPLQELAGSKTSRPRRGDPDAQGERRERCANISLARSHPMLARWNARDAARRSRRASMTTIEVPSPPLGRRMLAFPAHPRYARMLLAAQDYGCVRSVALIAALTQGRELLARRQAKASRRRPRRADRR